MTSFDCLCIIILYYPRCNHETAAEGEADSGDNFTKPPTKVSKLKPKSIPDPKVKPALKVKDESSPTGMAEKRSFSARGKGKKEDVVSDSSDQDVSSASPSLKRGLTKSASVSVSKKKKLSVVTKARSVEEDIDDEQEVPEAPRRTPRRSVRKIMKTVVEKGEDDESDDDKDDIRVETI
ncbi:hypothetical protein BC938DRAFT_473615 [Jimgerdemannia flammicorona]|uniref:Uncharacterized protein n=1 Tax=Jimgerdemannia flammicorona TaxID=994334 RepID=A0A433Q3L6_9FUNG|nr:hypothetical protein BC938DRAFT_473615 [Jimgerdemannia flammicorona]